MDNECRIFHCLNKTSKVPETFKVNSTSGLTLIELILVVAIIGTLCGIAVPAYSGHMKKVETRKAVSDILNIELGMEKFYAENGRYPDSLAEIGKDDLSDPWDQPYQYLRLPDDQKLREQQGRRLMKDKPLNRYYDLWSIGEDGRTNQSLTSNNCKDDILRLFDGAYIGLGEDLR